MTTFKIDLEELKALNIKHYPIIEFKLKNAKQILKNVLAEFLKLERGAPEIIWTKELEQVANWLSDSKGRGLLLYGNCGRGKTLLAQKVLPYIIGKMGKVVTVQDAETMTKKDLDNLMTKKIISLDDIGKEGVIYDYGNTYTAISLLMDLAEKRNNIVIATTNLNKSELGEYYDTRVLERFKRSVVSVRFEGESLRKGTKTN